MSKVALDQQTRVAKWGKVVSSVSSKETSENRLKLALDLRQQHIALLSNWSVVVKGLAALAR